MLDHLNFEKGIDEIRKVEAKVEKLKIAKRVIDTIKRNEFGEYYD